MSMDKQSEIGEVPKIPTAGDFIASKERALSHFDPEKNTGHHLQRLNFEVYMLRHGLEYEADRKLIEGPNNLGKGFWARDEQERVSLFEEQKKRPLSEFAEDFKRLTDWLEEDYKKRYGGKKYSEMNAQEEGEAREENMFLNIRFDLLHEMEQFKV